VGSGPAVLVKIDGEGIVRSRPGVDGLPSPISTRAQRRRSAPRPPAGRRM